MSVEPNKGENTNTGEQPPAYGTIDPSVVPPATANAGATGSVPPGYREGGYPNEPPPSYYDLYGHVKDIRQQSSGPVDFFKKVLAFLLGTLACTICVGVVIAIPIAMIVVGAMYKDECPGQRYIPIYLMVGGSFGLIKNLLNLGHRFRHKQQDDASDEDHIKQNPLDGLINCFLLAWFIAGCVWVYGLDPVTSDPSSAHYCHEVVYYFAYWLITSLFIFLALTCCCMTCAGCLGYLATNSSNNGGGGSGGGGAA